MKDEEEFMRLALEEAECAYAEGEVPVGAVAVYEGQVIGRSHNRKELAQDPTAHAEMEALRQAAQARGGWRLTGVTLYSTKEPCPMCAGAMVQARLSRLVYGARDAKGGAAGSVLDLVRMDALNHRLEVVEGVLAEEAGALLARFFQELRGKDRTT